MIKLIIGKKGSGKTKKLIDVVNEAAKTSKGNVVCIEQGDALRFSVSTQVRLVDTESYGVSGYGEYYAMLCGMAASNHDVTDLFLDGTLKICNYDYDAFEKLVVALDKLVEKVGLNMTMTVSMPEEKVTDTIRKFI